MSAPVLASAMCVCVCVCVFCVCVHVCVCVCERPEVNRVCFDKVLRTGEQAERQNLKIFRNASPPA